MTGEGSNVLYLAYHKWLRVYKALGKKIIIVIAINIKQLNVITTLMSEGTLHLIQINFIIFYYRLNIKINKRNISTGFSFLAGIIVLLCIIRTWKVWTIGCLGHKTSSANESWVSIINNTHNVYKIIFYHRICLVP